MALEYERWHDVPPGLRGQIKDYLSKDSQGTNQQLDGNSKKELAKLLNSFGIAVIFDENQGVLGVSEVESKDEKNTLFSSGVQNFIYIRGLGSTSDREKILNGEDFTIEEAREKRGLRTRRYRGKHRSHTRGANMKALIRRGFFLPKKFRGK